MYKILDPRLFFRGGHLTSVAGAHERTIFTVDGVSVQWMPFKLPSS